MISNQTLVNALNSIVILAADRKKVRSSDFQEKLIAAASEIAAVLDLEGADLRMVQIRDPESKTATWEVPFVFGSGTMEDVKFFIDVPALLK